MQSHDTAESRGEPRSTQPCHWWASYQKDSMSLFIHSCLNTDWGSCFCHSVCHFGGDCSWVGLRPNPFFVPKTLGAHSSWVIPLLLFVLCPTLGTTGPNYIRFAQLACLTRGPCQADGTVACSIWRLCHWKYPVQEAPCRLILWIYLTSLARKLCADFEVRLHDRDCA